jgi:hypothetical protein
VTERRSEPARQREANRKRFDGMDMTIGNAVDRFARPA